jgi:glycosyltransferase involved in cell wall biosynthesis
MSTIGGLEGQLAALATGLTQRGHSVYVFVRDPVRRQHPYRRRMESAGVRFSAPRPLLAALLNPGPGVRRRAATLLANVMLPALLIAVPIQAVRTKTGWRQVWRGGRTRLNWIFRRDLTFDALTWLLERRMDLAVKRHPPDIVDIQGSTLPAGIRYAKRRGFPTVYTEHGAPSEEYWPLWAGLQPVIDDVDFIIGRAAASLDGLRRLCGAMRPGVVVPQAVIGAPPPGEPPAPEPVGEEIVITAIGRLSPEKGHRYLLEAARRLADEGVHARFVLAGDGPLRADLCAQASALGLSERLEFGGAFPDVAPILQATHIMAHPTLNDGRSVAVLGAMAWGRPVVASRVGGVPELVEDGVSGLLVPPGDADALARALAQLAADHALRRRLGEAGRKRFLAGRFSVDSVAEATLEVYGRVLREHRPAAVGCA